MNSLLVELGEREGGGREGEREGKADCYVWDNSTKKLILFWGGGVSVG